MAKPKNVPMETLEDLLAYHVSEVDRHERLAEEHFKKYTYPKQREPIVNADIRRAEFHRKAVRVTSNAIADLKQYMG